MPPLPNLEAELLLFCANPRTLGVARPAEAVLQKVDWDRLEGYAISHGLDVQLLRSLASVGEHVPERLRAELTGRVAARAVRNLEQTREVLRLVDVLGEAGFEVIPFKGPVLAERLYGDVSLRAFSDLDILVRREDFVPVLSLLKKAGYDDPHGLDGRRLEAHIRTQMGYEMIDRRRNIIVEVHWAFVNRIHAFDLDPRDVWRRSVQRPFANTTVRAMSTEDLLVYLCAHGSKSFWTRVAWIADVAALIEREPPDWDKVAALADSLRAKRILNLGLRLSHGYFGTPLPEGVLRAVLADREAAALAGQVSSWLWNEEKRGPDGRTKIRFHLGLRERLRDRLPYYTHVLRILTQSRLTGQLEG